MPPMDDNERELRAEYQRTFKQYTDCAAYLKTTLTRTLQDKRINVHLVEARAKDVNSFIKKAFKPEKNYPNPITDITDLVGVRIIAYYESDLEAIGEHLRECFGPPQEQDNKRPEHDGVFGYRSEHYILPFTEQMVRAAEVGAMQHFNFEVQVRTVLQHAWASISHKVDYKNEGVAHDTLRRKLNRLSALFEIADDEFVSLRHLHEQLAKQIGEQMKDPVETVSLNDISVTQLLNSSAHIAGLVGASQRAGFIFNDPYRTEKDDHRALAGLLNLSTRAGLKTIEELADILEKNQDDRVDYLGMQYRRNQAKGRMYWYATTAFICQLLVIKERRNVLEPGDLVELGWDSAMADQVIAVARDCEPSTVH